MNKEKFVLKDMIMKIEKLLKKIDTIRHCVNIDYTVIILYT
ncbi:hypothetical protein [Tissierella sp.]|nr:hypothetical protein [Tissierella sp.]